MRHIYGNQTGFFFLSIYLETIEKECQLHDCEQYEHMLHV